MPDFNTAYGLLADILFESFHLFAAMAPYLLLGILVAGAMHVLLPVDFISRKLGRNTIGSVVKAGALGVPVPLCSCGVVPVAASLRANGASRGATVSFLVTTPTSGVDSIFATYSLLGWPFAVLRVGASFFLGVLAGLITKLVDTDTAEPAIAKKTERPGGGSIFKRGIQYAFDELYRGISRALLVGSLLGGAVTAIFPPEYLSETLGTGFASHLLMLAAGIPLYVCASGSIPVAAALLARGISPGGALIFLIAGPATNAATVAVVSRMLGRKTLLVYLLVLTLGTLGAGMLADAVLPASALLPAAEHLHHHSEEALGVLEWLSATFLLSLSVLYLAAPIVRKLKQNAKGKPMIEFTVPDMTCGHCAKTIENTVGAVDGVAAVHASPESKKVKIDAPAEITQQLKTAIEKAGYTPE